MATDWIRSGLPGSTEPMSGTGDLALFLGGDETSFIGRLLDLIAMVAYTNPERVEALRRSFPREVRAYQTWMAMSPSPTADELRAALDTSAPALPGVPSAVTGSQPVAGHCPACGWTSLFLGAGGYLTCARLECRQPDAAALLLDDAETAHIVTLDADPAHGTWTIRHPLIERLGDELLTCDLHEALDHAGPPGLSPGRYRVTRGADHGWSWAHTTMPDLDRGETHAH